MGLKVIADGTFGSGKTAFAASLAQIGDIGVIDTEQRWQFYTVPHPTAKPKKVVSDNGVELPAYLMPRMLRDDVSWLEPSKHIIWLVETMDVSFAWACHKVWARDTSIKGQVTDSISVLWDRLQAARDAKYEAIKAADGEEKANKVSALLWAPVKAAIRRMTFSAFEGGQHYIMCAHLKEKMGMVNGNLVVTSVGPWVEKNIPHWVDLVIQFVFSDGDTQPKVRIDIEKVLGGRGGKELVKGTIIAPTPNFRQLLEKVGVVPSVKTIDIDDVDRRTSQAIEKTKETR